MSEKQRKKKKNKISISRPAWYAILLTWIVTLLAAVFFAGRWGLNAYYVSEAREGRYHPEIAKMLTKLGLPDVYVVWYNLGNYYYDEEEFDKAEKAYLRAIECGIPYGKECPVKVNLALSMMAQITEEEWDEFLEAGGSTQISASARKAEKILKEARDVLTRDGCAHEDDDKGHDKAAQKLKEEIDELLEKSGMEEEQPEPGDEDDTGDDDNNDEPEDDDGDDTGGADELDEEEIEQYIQELLEENQDERSEDRQFYENYYGYGTEEGTYGGEYGEVW